MVAEVWEHRVQIERTPAIESIGTYLPIQKRLSEYLLVEVVEEPYKTQEGGALPRRTHEILTQFYIDTRNSSLALASPYSLRNRREHFSTI
jgi:ribosomal protein S16